MALDPALLHRFSIRRAKPEDADAVKTVFLASRLSAMPWLPILHAPDEVRNWIATIVIPFSRVFVAKKDGAVVGFAALKGDLLEHLYVRPGIQRLGVGTALLEAVKAESEPSPALYFCEKYLGTALLREARLSGAGSVRWFPQRRARARYSIGAEDSPNERAIAIY
jgi:GNAT superfamily N-acetyltransferase